MTAEKITNTLQELERVEKRALTLDQKATIAELYGIVLQKEFNATSCNDCYRDAVIEMLCYIRRHGEIKPVRKYRLKAGVVLQKAFGSATFYTDANITDEVAREFLRNDKSLVSLFSSLPGNWQEDVSENASNGAQTAENGVPATGAPKRTRKKRSKTNTK